MILALLSRGQVLMQEGVGETRKIRAAPGTADDKVGILAGHLHLLQGFLADDSLVHQYVTQHRPGRIFLAAAAGRSSLYGFRHGQAERPGVVGIFARAARPAWVRTVGLA